jgi:hypothetical protein
MIDRSQITILLLNLSVISIVAVAVVLWQPDTPFKGYITHDDHTFHDLFLNQSSEVTLQIENTTSTTNQHKWSPLKDQWNDLKGYCETCESQLNTYNLSYPWDHVRMTWTSTLEDIKSAASWGSKYATMMNKYDNSSMPSDYHLAQNYLDQCNQYQDLARKHQNTTIAWITSTMAGHYPPMDHPE